MQNLGQNLEQDFRFISWNLQYEGQRQGAKLGLKERMASISAVLRSLSQDKPSVFCLQEVDSAMSAELVQQLGTEWEQVAAELGFTQGMRHTAVIVYNSRDFRASQEAAFKESGWTKNENTRWSPITRLSHRRSGISCDVVSSHLRGFNLGSRDADDLNLSSLTDCRVALAQRRESVELSSKVAFQVLGMDANREAHDKVLLELLAQSGFVIDRPAERTATTPNADIGPAALDCVAIAAGSTEARIIQTWQQVDPGFPLATSYADLSTPTDHHPSVTDVSVSMDLEAELSLALEHLQRAASAEKCKQLAPFLGYIKERSLLEPLRLHFLRRCIEHRLEPSELKVAKLLHLPQLCRWNASLKRQARRQDLTTLLLKDPEKKLHSKTRIHLIFQLELEQAEIDHAALIKALAASCRAKWRAQWPAGKLASYLLEHPPSKQTQAAWSQVAAHLVAPARASVTNRQRLELLEQLAGLEGAPACAAEAEAQEWLRQLQLGDCQQHAYGASRLRKLAKRLPDELLQDFCVAVLSCKLDPAIKARCVLHVQSLGKALPKRLVILASKVCVARAAQGFEADVRRLFGYVITASSLAHARQLLGELSGHLSGSRPAMAECIRAVIGLSAQAESAEALKALDLVEKLSLTGFQAGSEANHDTLATLVKALAAAHPERLLRVIRVLKAQSPGRRTRILLLDQSKVQSDELCRLGKDKQAKELIEAAEGLCTQSLPRGPELWQQWLIEARRTPLTIRCELLTKARDPDQILKTWMLRKETPPATLCLPLVRCGAVPFEELRAYLQRLCTSERLQLELDLLDSLAEQLYPTQGDWATLFCTLIEHDLFDRLLTISRRSKSSPVLTPLLTWLETEPDLERPLAHAITIFCCKQLGKKKAQSKAMALLRLGTRYPSLWLWQKLHRWELGTKEQRRAALLAALNQTTSQELRAELAACEAVTGVLTGDDLAQLALKPHLLVDSIDASWLVLATQLLKVKPDLIKDLSAPQLLSALASILDERGCYQNLSLPDKSLIELHFTELAQRFAQLGQAEQEEVIVALDDATLLCWRAGALGTLNAWVAPLYAQLNSWGTDRAQKIQAALPVARSGRELPESCAAWSKEVYARCLDPEQLDQLSDYGVITCLNLAISAYFDRNALGLGMILELFTEAWNHCLETGSLDLAHAWMGQYTILVQKEGKRADGPIAEAIYECVKEDLIARATGQGRRPDTGMNAVIHAFSRFGFRPYNDIIQATPQGEPVRELNQQLNTALDGLHEANALFSTSARMFEQVFQSQECSQDSDK